MKSKSMHRTVRRALLLGAMAALLAGCDTLRSTVTPAWAPGQTASTESVPRVQDCAIVAISSPSRYACNGKVYTSFQLAKMRMAEEKKYASGN